MRIKLPFFATFHLDTEHVNTAGCSRPRLSPSILRCNPPLSWPPAQASQETRRVRDCCRLHLGPGDQLRSQSWPPYQHWCVPVTPVTVTTLSTSHQPSPWFLAPWLVAAGRPDYLWAALWPRLWHHFYANHHIFHQLGHALKITLYGRKILHNRNKRGINISLTTLRVFSLRDTRLRCLLLGAG